MKRRRGSVLIASIIVMVILMIFGGGIFVFAYTNFRSAEQQMGIMRARAVADAFLFSMGSVISDDCARPKASWRLPLSNTTPLSADFVDGLISADMAISMQGDRVFLLDCYARYRTWYSGRKSLQLVRMSVGSGDMVRWLWK